MNTVSSIRELPAIDLPSPFGPWQISVGLNAQEILKRLQDLVPENGMIPGVDCPKGLFEDMRYRITPDGFLLRWRLRDHPWEFSPPKGFTDPRLAVTLEANESETNVLFNIKQGVLGLHSPVLFLPLAAALGISITDGTLHLPQVIFAITWIPFALKVWPFRFSAMAPKVNPLIRALFDLTDPRDRFVLEEGRVKIVVDA